MHGTAPSCVQVRESMALPELSWQRAGHFVVEYAPARTIHEKKP